ncbi:MAG: hypothetical protein JW955_20415 [Sedimentisphaerales bacterium]|nr:hypothetical protein [Sedimentisphaerales bacterium]
MKWHVVARVGEADDYAPQGPFEVNPLFVPFQSPGAPHPMREHVLDGIRRSCGRAPEAGAIDLLRLAMSVYSADMLIPRSTAQDRWTRECILHLPVADTAAWENARETLERGISFLTGDCWSLSFRELAEGEDDELPFAEAQDQSEVDAVVLCSGGLDSLAGAIARASDGSRIALVGHYGGGSTSKFQHDVMNALCAAPGLDMRQLSFHVLPPQLPGCGEDTMRSRSLLFLGLGIAVANAYGACVPVIVPENGLIGLNVPLTGARVGSASTRTTHPHFISCLNEVVRLIGLNHDIALPYRFKTKGEMLAEAESDLLRKTMSLSMSCSHPEQSRWEGETPGQHCGYCLPCMIRHAAVVQAGLTAFDAQYTHDLSSSTASVTGAKARDCRAVRMAIERLRRQGTPRDVFAVLDTGPLPPEEVQQYASVYRRGMQELAGLFGESL